MKIVSIDLRRQPETVPKNVLKYAHFHFVSLFDLTARLARLLSPGYNVVSKEMVDASLVRGLKSCPEQSRVAPLPIGDGTFSKEWFLLVDKAYID